MRSPRPCCLPALLVSRDYSTRSAKSGDNRPPILRRARNTREPPCLSAAPVKCCQARREVPRRRDHPFLPNEKKPRLVPGSRVHKRQNRTKDNFARHRRSRLRPRKRYRARVCPPPFSEFFANPLPRDRG